MVSNAATLDLRIRKYELSRGHRRLRTAHESAAVILSAAKSLTLGGGVTPPELDEIIRDFFDVAQVPGIDRVRLRKAELYPLLIPGNIRSFPEEIAAWNANIDREGMLKLQEAARCLIQRSFPDGERLAALISDREWETKNHPIALKAYVGEDGPTLYAQAYAAWEEARKQILDRMKRGEIIGEYDGRHYPASVWRERSVDWWSSRIQPRGFKNIAAQTYDRRRRTSKGCDSLNRDLAGALDVLVNKAALGFTIKVSTIPSPHAPKSLKTPSQEELRGWVKRQYSAPDAKNPSQKALVELAKATFNVKREVIVLLWREFSPQDRQRRGRPLKNRQE